MFKDEFNIKGVAIGLIGYLVTSVAALAVIFQLWMPTGITGRAELTQLAEADQSLLIWQSLLGLVLGVLAGLATCHFSGARGLRNSLILGCLFVLYGMVGIGLHPTHPTVLQVGKVISPIPITLLGGWLRLRFSSPRGAVRGNA